MQVQNVALPSRRQDVPFRPSYLAASIRFPAVSCQPLLKFSGQSTGVLHVELAATCLNILIITTYTSRPIDTQLEDSRDSAEVTRRRKQSKYRGILVVALSTKGEAELLGSVRIRKRGSRVGFIHLHPLKLHLNHMPSPPFLCLMIAITQTRRCQASL